MDRLHDGAGMETTVTGRCGTQALAEVDWMDTG
jgi:hypothetical protein